MSYILDALRKADQERSIGHVPDLDTPHWSRRRGGQLRYWVWGGIGLLIVNGVLLAFLFNRDDGGDARPGVSSYLPDQTEGKPLVAPPGLQHETITKPRSPDSLPLKQLARPERSVVTEPRQPVPRVVERPAAISAPGAGSEAPAAVTTAPVVQPATRQPVRTSTPEIPEWSEMSLEFRSGFSPPRLDVHVYDDEPSRRFILIDLQRFSEGDTLDSGAKLEKILPGSIQLYYQGTRFRIDR
jgi:general secretion pathway protein B